MTITFKYLYPMMIFLILNVVAGCVSGREGLSVDQASRIILQPGGSQSGEWQGRDLKVIYRYSWNGSNLAIEGEVRFPGAKLIETFDLTVSVVDASGKILVTKKVASSPYRKMIDKISFSESIPITEGAHSLAFGYRGTSRGVGGGSGSPSSFWHNP